MAHSSRAAAGALAIALGDVGEALPALRPLGDMAGSPPRPGDGLLAGGSLAAADSDNGGACFGDAARPPRNRSIPMSLGERLGEEGGDAAARLAGASASASSSSFSSLSAAAPAPPLLTFSDYAACRILGLAGPPGAPLPPGGWQPPLLPLCDSGPAQPPRPRRERALTGGGSAASAAPVDASAAASTSAPRPPLPPHGRVFAALKCVAGNYLRADRPALLECILNSELERVRAVF